MIIIFLIKIIPIYFYGIGMLGMPGMLAGI